MSTTKATQAPTFTLSKAGQRYNPRATTQHGHHTNWQAITGYLKAHKGQATMADLLALGQTLPQQVQGNHKPYVQYAVRRGWLVPTK